MQYQDMSWTVETLNAVVDAEISGLPADMRARLVRVLRLIEALGFQNLPSGTVKHLEGKLWEVRISATSGIGRAIYVTATGQRIIIVRAFVKKTQKTPRREVELARQRAREVT
jgi:phage-related protein